MVIFFDVDDTLYNQIEPFSRAFYKNFSNIHSIDIEKLFLASRKYSDEVFHKTEKMEMSLREMHVYRISKAFEEFGHYILPESALAFQIDYERYQDEISISPDMKETLEFLITNGIKIGIITNGPEEHQKKKINTLGLKRWVSDENITVSGEVGFAKPEREIFQLAKERMKIQEDRIYYVGDSFENDVMGALNAGWTPIWINKRKREISNIPNNLIYEVNEEKSILKIVENIVLVL